jgi:hypothetical protein
MGKYWTHINLPGWETSIPNIRKEFIPTLPPNVFWNFLDLQRFKEVAPEMVEAFAKGGFEIQKVSIVQARGKANIHIDSGPAIARINVPLLNCRHSFTSFYKTNAQPKLMETNVKFGHLRAEDCRIVDSVELRQPTVLRISAPHGVTCAPDAGHIRYSLTFNVTPDPVSLLQPLT